MSGGEVGTASHSRRIADSTSLCSASDSDTPLRRADRIIATPSAVTPKAITSRLPESDPETGKVGHPTPSPSVPVVGGLVAAAWVAAPILNGLAVAIPRADRRGVVGIA